MFLGSFGLTSHFFKETFKLELRKIGRYDNHTMVLVVRLVDTVARLLNIVAVHLDVLIFKPWSKVRTTFGCVLISWILDSINCFSETELEKNNNLGKCCKFLKVDSGLTYSGTYELNTGMIFQTASRLAFN